MPVMEVLEMEALGHRQLMAKKIWQENCDSKTKEDIEEEEEE